MDLSEDEIKVVECIEKGVNEIDDLARNLFMNVSELSSFLTILELKEVLTVNGKRIQLNM
ncbi:hypothetical protein HMPREF9129_1957 [Peptoniphilus indolicus ATCC 29427]|uniref:DprA winged helix domain-containing protein n=1 Tax=Peptoniphilus indolicus ATCC 29427 TaxID=997350 RepID=G4D6C7_9FIRM|nr:hypothetical protein [Peptoniphilus indolicus]EGY76603.1 hypothetical protein HMPREF9129_1957 [Peptoniphilus indolicus ATCC 29427]